MDQNHRISRRALLAAAPLAAAGRPIERSVADLPFSPTPIVRLGFVGVGRRGMSLLENFLELEHVEVPAVCDVSAERAGQAGQLVEKARHAAPEIYAVGSHSFEQLCAREDIDIVVAATPWKWHTPVAACAMESGKHAAVEVPMATSIDELWRLVQLSEQTRRHCIMLENCCYGYNELLILNMVRDGKLGELTHGTGGYLHNLRDTLTSLTERPWMRDEYLRRNGNLYPTHGLGPIAQCMGIHRGDRFERLTSVSSPGSAIGAMVKPPARFRCGDQNTTLLTTSKGLLITLEHNVATPEPYDRLTTIAGTRGIFRDFPPRLFIDGETAPNQWEGLDRFQSRYEHPFWKSAGRTAGPPDEHGDMDFVMCHRLMECMHRGLAPDMNVYDGAAWSAVAPLSEQSVSAGGAPVAFPDFTRGGWTNPSARGETRS